MGWLKIYLENDRITVQEEGVRDTRYFNSIDYEIDDTTVYIRGHYYQYIKKYEVLFADFQDGDGNVVTDIPAYLSSTSKVKADVSIQDSTSPEIIANLSSIVAETTLTAEVGDITTFVTDINVVSVTGLAVGQYLSIFSIPSNRFYVGQILAINSLVVSLDTPLDFNHPIGAFVTGGSRNMAINGSVTPQIFGLRNTDEVIGVSMDITRLMIYGETNALGTLEKFGDIAGGLTKGVVIRKVDGSYKNIINWKTNGDMSNTMYDFKLVPAAGNAQDGFVGRFTLAKLGSVIRLAPGEDLQVIIQDDLSSLVNFSIQAQGSEVTD